MLFILTVLLTLMGVAIVSWVRSPGGVNAAPLGWMSQRWLAEYRASHPT
jgi:hypothetical protein